MLGSGGVRCLGVDALPKRDGIELRVCRLFLVEVAVRQADDFVVTKLLGPGNQE